MDIQDVDRREVLRYLGYRGQEADGRPERVGTSTVSVFLPLLRT